MISRWQQGQINTKYDKVQHDLEERNREHADAQTKLDLSEKYCNDLYVEFEERMRMYEKSVTDLKGKIIPTVNLHRVEEMHNRITEMVQLKLDLEINNRKLREQVNELSLKCDYYETQREQLDKLESDIKNRNIDDMQQRLIEYSQEISQLKMQEMK